MKLMLHLCFESRLADEEERKIIVKAKTYANFITSLLSAFFGAES